MATKPTPEKKDEKPRTTRLGTPMDQAVSALAKELRAGNEEGAAYWMLSVYQQGPAYCWRRLCLAAVEDVGMADPQAVALVAQLHTLWSAARLAGWPDPGPAVMATLVICRARRSTEVDDLKLLVTERLKRKELLPIKPAYLDGHTAAGRAAQGTPDWRDWFRFRVASGAPVNRFTRALWKLRPDWAPEDLADDPSPSDTSGGER